MCTLLLLCGMLCERFSGISGLVGSPYHLYLDDLATVGRTLECLASTVLLPVSPLSFLCADS